MHSRRTKLVLAAVQALAHAGKQSFTPADVGLHLRTHAQPMSAWEVRGELSNLEASGDVRIDPATALWTLTTPPPAAS